MREVGPNRAVTFPLHRDVKLKEAFMNLIKLTIKLMYIN